MNIQIENIKKNLAFELKYSVYNRKRIYLRASKLYRESKLDGLKMTWGKAQKQVWNEARLSVTESREQVKALKAKLLYYYTPVQRHETHAYLVERMLTAHRNGKNLNK